MDLGGVVAARRFAQSQVVTASIERVDFHAPIDLGDIAVLTAYVYDVGETSMQVRVDVTAERPSESVERDTASSHLTFVAIDDAENVQSVPELTVETAEERRLRDAARNEAPAPTQ
ncbi:acyl-CoA esterase [Halolamina pelagica]|uniref:Acyl-CoA esterase n=1 Tax=Halolamina pelagica TaxID=699431 RepID=A0A0P7GXQ1_9EURY|nr:acyl-CoA esterase [Halolamina pelagica]